MSEVSAAEVVRWRRKPQPSEGEQIAARYTPGGDLSALLAVARMCDSGAQVAEVPFSVETVLVVRYNRYTVDGYELDFEVVRPGRWLAYSESSESLYDSTDGNWAHFYERAAQ